MGRSWKGGLFFPDCPWVHISIHYETELGEKTFSSYVLDTLLGPKDFKMNTVHFCPWEAFSLMKGNKLHKTKHVYSFWYTYPGCILHKDGWAILNKDARHREVWPSGRICHHAGCLVYLKSQWEWEPGSLRKNVLNRWITSLHSRKQGTHDWANCEIP